MAGTRKTTIRDVAAAAGVSVTTVSDALSGKGRLPDETRQKVKETATKLGYRPSAIALGLRERGLGLVGICIAPAGNAALTDVGYWATIVTHASQAFLSEGLAPVLLPHNVDMLAKLKIPLDGVILVDPLPNDAVLTFFEKKLVRYVTIGRDLERDSQTWLDDDNEAGVQLVLDETVAPGSKIAMVTIGQQKSYVVDALSGVNRWANEHRSSVTTSRTDDLEAANVEAAVGKAIRSGADVLIAQHDRLALRIAAALQSLGKTVPGDMRLVSITDSPELAQAAVPITAVCQHAKQLAEMTAKALMDIINGKTPSMPVRLPMQTIIRQSAPSLLV